MCVELVEFCSLGGRLLEVYISLKCGGNYGDGWDLFSLCLFRG